MRTEQVHLVVLQSSKLIVLSWLKSWHYWQGIDVSSSSAAIGLFHQHGM